MELINSKRNTSIANNEFANLQAADPQAIAYAWQRRLNSYLKSGEII